MSPDVLCPMGWAKLSKQPGRLLEACCSPESPWSSEPNQHQTKGIHKQINISCTYPFEVCFLVPFVGHQKYMMRFTGRASRICTLWGTAICPVMKLSYMVIPSCQCRNCGHLPGSISIARLDLPFCCCFGLLSFAFSANSSHTNNPRRFFAGLFRRFPVPGALGENPYSQMGRVYKKRVFGCHDSSLVGNSSLPRMKIPYLAITYFQSVNRSNLLKNPFACHVPFPLPRFVS